MKKRLMAKILSSVMIVSFITVNGGIQPILVKAAEVTQASTTYSCEIDGIVWDYEVDTVGNAINVGTKYTSIMKENGIITSIHMPNTLDGHVITSIKVGTFQDCIGLTNIDLPKGLKSIDNAAFYGCKSLTSIVIPEGVTSIGSRAFFGCSSLKSVLIPEGVTTLGMFTFENCYNLSSISLPDSIQYICESAFCECYRLKTVYANSGSYVSNYYWRYGKVDNITGYTQGSLIINSIINTKNNAKEKLVEGNRALLRFISLGGVEKDIRYQSLKTTLQAYLTAELIEAEEDITELQKWVSEVDGEIIDINSAITPVELNIYSFTANVDSPQNIGTPITLDTISSGGEGTVQTKYTLIDGTTDTLLRDYSAEKSYVWIPTKAGTYIIKASVMDLTGKEVTQSKTFVINKELGMDNFTVSVASPQVVGSDITLNTTSSGGDGTLYTKFEVVDDYGRVDVLLRDYSTEGSFVWTPAKARTYKVKASVKDSTIHCVAKELTYVVYDPVNLKSVTLDQGSSIDLGKSVNINADAAGGNGKLSYSISAENNGTIEKISEASQNNTATWIPTKAGVWNITVTAVDESGNKSEKQVTLEVKDIAKNQTTIYYKGYSTPYIHYKVGTGNWTIIPGVAMTPTTEMPGYTHKITIDLGTASTLTACFNNGTGSWDSRNGANYIFNAGTYDYSNGIITKVQEPVKTLTINSFTSSIESKVAVGKSVILTGNATSDVSNIEYKMSVINSKNETTVIKDYSTSNIASWTPLEAGDYTLVLDVKDSNGKTATTQMKLQGYDVTSNLTTIYYKGYTTPYIHYKVGTGSWTLAPGVAMTPTTEMPGYTHKITIDLGTASTLTACFNNGSGSWDSRNGANYTFNAGTYDYSNGIITKVQEPVKTLTINSFTSNIIGKLNVGTSVILTGNATSDASTIEYKMSVINSNNETKVIKDYSASNISSWTPSEAGEYTLVLEAKDSNGKTARTEMKVQAYSVSSHITTIYYKGYTTPYIHYKVGNGSWTQVPGVAMIATTEKVGYTHKISIDLGEADTVTVCFNNGSGSWDSKNGANYTFNSGTYTYSNGNSILINN